MIFSAFVPDRIARNLPSNMEKRVYSRLPEWPVRRGLVANVLRSGRGVCRHFCDGGMTPGGGVQGDFSKRAARQAPSRE